MILKTRTSFQKAPDQLMPNIVMGIGNNGIEEDIEANESNIEQKLESCSENFLCNSTKTTPRPATSKPVSTPKQTHQAIGRSSQSTNPNMAKTSYNPITHVSSKSCFTVQLYIWTRYLNTWNRLKKITLFFYQIV